MERSLAEYSLGLTDKDCHHRYCTLFYDAALAKYRDQRVELLEIGVGAGGSLVMWHRYFRNAARIVGIDAALAPSLLDAYLRGFAAAPDNIMLKQGDAYFSRVGDDLGAFDIIIDDGPHTFDSHLAVLLFYLPKLKPGGMLVIEDVADVRWTSTYQRAVELHPRHTHKTIDLRHEFHKLPDDVLFVVEKDL
jgi:cephalosporin hydroxylase